MPSCCKCCCIHAMQLQQVGVPPLCRRIPLHVHCRHQAMCHMVLSC